MSLITPENVHQRPQRRIALLIRPVRMPPARSTRQSMFSSKNFDRKGSGRTTKTKKKREARPPPMRARRQTIDSLRWGMQLSGIFLDDLPPPQGESMEIEEVGDILDVSDQTPSPCNDITPPHASCAELDLAAERVSALDLLGAVLMRQTTTGVAQRASILTWRWLVYCTLRLARSNPPTLRLSQLITR